MSSNIAIPPVYILDDNDYEMLRLKKDVATQFITNAQDYLKDEDINFTGDLSASLALVIIGQDVTVETNNPYAHFIEFGMPPGQFIDFDALSDWVRIKLNVPDEMVEGVTWKILLKLRKEGFKPTRFWKRSILKLVKKHSLKNPRKPRKPRSKYAKIVRHIARVLRKINKYIKKSTKYYKILERGGK